MFEDFLLKPFLVIIFISVISSAMGSLVLWKRLSYFGDAMSHSILLGFVVGSFFDSNQTYLIAIFAILFAILVGVLIKNDSFSKDTMVMISTFFCVSCAVIFNDLITKNFDFSSYIFGDVLAVETNEIVALGFLLIAVICYLFLFFKKVFLCTIDEDLAKIQGINVKLVNFLFLILLSLTIAFSIKVIGIFLMTALLIMPAAIARIYSSSPVQMMILSVLIGVVFSSSSFAIASIIDLSVAPAIILAFCLIFFISLFLRKFFKFN